MPSTAMQPIDLSFPLGGVNRSMGFSRQPNVPAEGGRYYRTTPLARNVVARELVGERIRGGTRPALSRYINAQVGGSTGLIQFVGSVVGVGYSAPGGQGQSNDSGHVVTIVVVKGGNVYVADVGGTAYTAATNDTGFNPPLNSTGIVRATVLNQKVYFFDGAHACYYDPALNKVRTWGASSGTFPADTSGNYAKIGGTWRGRLVHCIGQDWLMSAIGDGTDYNFDPDTTVSTEAVAGSESDLGLVGDLITGFIPYDRDTAIFLCDHELWVMEGDPLAGGSLNPISKNLGGAYGQAWTTGPDGTIYFFSNTRRLYRMSPREAPLPISQPIDSMLSDVNTGTYTVTMGWDDLWRGLVIFVTKTSAAAAAQHFMFDESTGGWFPLDFANSNHNPLCCAIIDGNTADDRRLLIGSWDGYLRGFDPDAEDDDGSPIASEVWLGPIQSDGFEALEIREFQAELGEESGDVDWAVHVGRTAEQAFASAAAGSSGTFSAGRSNTVHVKRTAFASYLKLTSEERWQIEKVRVGVVGKEYVRRRRIY